MGSALESENLSNPNLGKPTSSSAQEIAILGLKLPYFKRASSKLGGAPSVANMTGRN
jgi:hypothetical protein